ncbi:MAG: winged helix-turn-helix transcriptional regulator [Candidatus Roizmanbacteria bacterium]|nr:winged helix-turn-helix transcriptional regulator [Candidatus Roizmanbacteria bacterium]
MDNNPLFRTEILGDDIDIIFNLSGRVINALFRHGISTVSDLKKVPDRETLYSIRGLGTKSVDYILSEYKRVFHNNLFSDKSEDNQFNLEGYNLSKISNTLSLVPLKSESIIKEQINKIVKIDHRKRPFDEAQKQRILELKKQYDEIGSLQGVARKIGLSKERVRQLLEKGNKFGLFSYVSIPKLKFKQLTEILTKDELIKQINSKTIIEICNKYNITLEKYFKLKKLYKIDAQVYRHNAKQEKYYNQYLEVFNQLGHHPTTTELSKKKEWRNLWHCILTNWGSMENFRFQYQITPQKMPRELSTGLADYFISRKIIREELMERIIIYLKQHGSISSVEITKNFNIKRGSVHVYINELIEKEVIYSPKGLRNRKFYLVEDR